MALVVNNNKTPANAGDHKSHRFFLVQEDPLEEGMGIHSSILAWRIPMDRGGWWGIWAMRSQRINHD